MATIINALALTTSRTSSAVTNPNNIRIHFEITGAGSTDEAWVYYQTKDGASYAKLTDENDKLVYHKLQGNAIVSRNFIGVNSALMQVVVVPNAGHAGTITVTTFES